MSTGTGREKLFALSVVLPENHWAAALPALSTARRRAEGAMGAPVGASFDLGGRKKRKSRFWLGPARAGPSNVVDPVSRVSEHFTPRAVV
jgi:hypothetical protein